MAGYKYNSKKSVALLYTSDKWAEKEVIETISFIKATNNIKYLAVTLTKQVKDLYDKNFKSPGKEIEKKIGRMKDFHVSGLTVKMAILPKSIY